jgi:hypothetical protein
VPTSCQHCAMSDQRARKSRLEAPLVGHHSVTILPAPPATTGFFPIRASDVLFNRPITDDQGRVQSNHEHFLPISDSRFIHQHVDGVSAMTMSMIPGRGPAILGQRSITPRVPMFPFITSPNPYSSRHIDGVEVHLAAARMQEATSLLLWASLTQASGFMASSISPTYWPAAQRTSMPQLVVPGAIDIFPSQSASQDHHYISSNMQLPVRDSTNTSLEFGVKDTASKLSTREQVAKTRTSPLLITQQHGSENFPMVLQRLLANLELIPSGTNIISFLPDGLSFVVKNQHLFSKQVLPIYFPKMKSFASFQRQLNLYDFKRVGRLGSDQGAYRHKSFLRDNPSLSSTMRRTKIKGTKRSDRNKET